MRLDWLQTGQFVLANCFSRYGLAIPYCFWPFDAFIYLKWELGYFFRKQVCVKLCSALCQCAVELHPKGAMTLSSLA